MSALWLIPQFNLNGLPEVFNSICQSKFFYSEFPENLSTIAGALFGLRTTVANLLATIILSTVDQITSEGGKDGWFLIISTRVIMTFTMGFLQL